MLNYAQKSLRKVTQELDENYVKQEAWEAISDKTQAITLTLTSGGTTFTVHLNNEQVEEVLDLTSHILAQEEHSLKSQELSWCREITLLDKQEQAALTRKSRRVRG